MGTSSARPDDLHAFVRGSRAADDELRTRHSRLRAAYHEFRAGTRWGQFDASSLIAAFGQYIELNETDARWVAQIAEAFRAAGGDGDLARLPDAAIEASLRAAGLAGGRASVTFDSPVAYGFPPTTGYANDPVNTASGNFVHAEEDLAAARLAVRRVYNSRSDAAGSFGPGWSSWADARLIAREHGAEYAGPDGQRALFPRQGAGYGPVLGVPASVHTGPDGLQLHWSDGRRWTFDAAGRPMSAAHGGGPAVTFAYRDGRLAAMHRGARSIAFDWAGERITGAAASDGRRIGYEYRDGVLIAAGPRTYTADGSGRLAAVADADGVVDVTNVYDGAGRVTEQVSRFGRRTRFAYLPGRVTVTAGAADGAADTWVHDDLGRLLAVVDGHGGRLSRTYDERGNPVTVTDRSGAVTTMAWDDRSRLVRRQNPGQAAFAYTYDDADRVTTVTTSAGATVRFRYRGAERTPSEVVDAEGGVTRLDVRDGLVHGVTDPDGVTVSAHFDADGALVSTTDGAGQTARFERDAAGRVIAAVTPAGRRTTFRYGDHDKPVERRDPAGGIWRFEYSAAGRLTAVVDPAGARREHRYGRHGEVEATVDPLGATRALRYDPLGNLAGMVDPGGAEWEFRHDALSRLTAITDPAGAVWQREYDAGGNLVASVDPAGARYTATVDGAGRIGALGDGLTGVTFDYDDLGRTVGYRRPDGTGGQAGYDRCGRRVTVTDPAGGVTRIEYTPGGRVRRTIAPSGAVTEFGYDVCGRLGTRTDPAGRRWSYRYDPDGGLVEQIDPDGARRTYAYDAAGRLVRSRAPGVGVTTTEYDAAGRATRIINREYGSRRFGYDLAGRLVTATDALGHTTRYRFDERGRVVAVTDPEGGTTSLRYDDLGRPIAQTDPLGRTATVEYDAAGRIAARTDASGRRWSWTRDVSGRVISVTASGHPAVTVERDALGRVIAIDEPGAPRIEQHWDPLGRLVRHRRGDADLSWAYDADGHRVAVGDTMVVQDPSGVPTEVRHPTAGAVSLRRDPVGRLVAAIGAGWRAEWRYTDGDLTGYRFGSGPETTVTRDDAGRVVAASTDGRSLRFGYDAAGQLRSADGRAFDYDANGRLVREDGPAGEIRYAYDAAGRLRTRQAGPAVTRYEYDGAGRRTAELDGDRRIEYRWDALGRLAGIGDVPVTVDALGELATAGGVPVRFDTGHPRQPPQRIGDRTLAGSGQPWTGAPDGPVDWQGTPGTAERDPWGAPAHPGPAALGYRGEVELAGHVWLRDRVYAPASRSFLQPDAMPPVPGSGWAANPYHYAGNDPVNRVDPLGLRPVTDAELRDYRDQLGRDLWDRTTEWVRDNWEYLAAGAMVVAGVGLMFTGVGGPAGLALMAASGGLISAGVSAGVQRFTTGEVDWGQVGTDALIGAAAGGVGGAAGMLAGRATLLTANNPVTRGMITGGVDSTLSGMAGRALAGDNPFDPRGMATDLLIGVGTGGVGGRLGAGVPGSPEQSRLIVQAAVDRANAMPLDELLANGTLRPGQLNQLMTNPRTSPMFAGHAIHNMSAQILEDAHPGRFLYNASRGPDITDRVNDVQVEIATVAQEAFKLDKYPGVQVATYRWSPW